MKSVSLLRRRERGYTVVEVMSAMTLFAIGAAGVISAQKVTIQGGDDARRFDMASNIAREWEHRLQRDSFGWTEPNTLVTTSNLLTKTIWLHPGTINANAWAVPADGPLASPDPEAQGYGHAFDLLGRDVKDTDPDHVFCVQYRLAWIAPIDGPLATDGLSPTAIIRAQVRVFWSRLENGPADCSVVDVFEDTVKRQKHHFVFVTTALRENPSQ